MKSPKKAQTTCLNASFGPKVCFLFILYVILFLPPTTHHVAASPSTLQPPAQPYTPRHHEQPHQRVGGASRREIKQKRVARLPFLFFSVHLLLHHSFYLPNTHTIICMCIQLIFFLFF